MGQLYLSNVDFLKNGVPASIIATMVRSLFSIVGDKKMMIFSAVIGRRYSWLFIDVGHRVCLHTSISNALWIFLTASPTSVYRL